MHFSPKNISNVCEEHELIVNQLGSNCELISTGYFNINWMDEKTYSIKHLFVEWGLSYLMNEPAKLNNHPGKCSFIYWTLHRYLLSRKPDVEIWTF